MAHTVHMIHLAVLDTLYTSKARTAFPRGVMVPDRQWMVAPADSGLPANPSYGATDTDGRSEVPSEDRCRFAMCDEMAGVRTRRRGR